MVARRETHRILSDRKLTHDSEKTKHHYSKSNSGNQMRDDTDSSKESEADTQESEVFAYNGKRERTYNNSHKQHSNNQYKKQSYNQNQSNSSSHQNGHSQPQRSNYKNEDINVNPFTQNQNQPQANHTNQSQQQAPVQQNKTEPKQGFNQFDMNEAPSQGAPTHQYPEKPTFIPDGSPDCPGHAEGRQLTIEEALRTRIENCKKPFLYNTGKGPNIEKIRYTFPKSYATDNTCPLCGPGHRLIQCPKSSSNVRKWFEENRVCTNCKGRHSLNYCKSDTSCYYCNGRHNTAACKLKEFFRDYRNFPEKAPKPTDIQFFLDQQQQ
ncbi:hypothetical protein CRE_17712 [Caenorhabditis remanei]|uniref:Nanos-type domain-containing protein n=1 Tax=Caenorhabditis remanei TaxID=31234 RepID=E3NUB3_CAERE|nr:hypothetical protein CRE_17712 [Caenorhabditis remanei]